MALGPLQRWRPRTVNTISDVRETLHDLERILKLYVYHLETDVVLTGSPAPSNAQYLVAASDPALTAERVFQSGTNTTFVAGVGTAQVNVADASTLAKGVVELAANLESAAGLAVQANDGRLSNARPPTGTAGGDLAGTYPNPTLDAIRNNAVVAGTPLHGEFYVQDDNVDGGLVPRALAAGEGIDVTVGVDGTSTISAEDASTVNRGIIQIANDLAGTATAPIVAGIRDVNVENVTPTQGDILRHDGTDWKVRPEERVFMPTDFFLSSNAVLLTGAVTNAWLRIEFANATTPDPFAWVSTRFRDEWYDTNLTLQVAFRGTGTGGNMRVWWNLADAGTGIDGTANAVTVAINASSKSVHSLSTTINISSAAGARNVTLLVGRDHDHVDDNIADTVDFLFARVFPT